MRREGVRLDAFLRLVSKEDGLEREYTLNTISVGKSFLVVTECEELSFSVLDQICRMAQDSTHDPYSYERTPWRSANAHGDLYHAFDLRGKLFFSYTRKLD